MHSLGSYGAFGIEIGLLDREIKNVVENLSYSKL